jgi:hypothetical protein
MGVFAEPRERSSALAERHVGSRQPLKRTFGAWRFWTPFLGLRKAFALGYHESQLRCWSPTREPHPFLNSLLVCLGPGRAMASNERALQKAPDLAHACRFALGQQLLCQTDVRLKYPRDRTAGFRLVGDFFEFRCVNPRYASAQIEMNCSNSPVAIDLF